MFYAIHIFLTQFLEPQPMTRHQVFAMHRSAPEPPLPPPVGEFPLNTQSLVATPIKTPGAEEEKVKKPKGKKKLSVREMVRARNRLRIFVVAVLTRSQADFSLIERK